MNGGPRGWVLITVLAVTLGACSGVHLRVQHHQVIPEPTTTSALANTVPGAACSAPATLSSGVSIGPARLGAVDFLSREVGVALTAPAVPCEVPRVGISQQVQPVRLGISNDGGTTWATRGSTLLSTTTATSTQQILEQVAPVSTTTVWALSDKGALAFTTNSGTTWAAQPLPAPVVNVAMVGDWLWALSCPPAAGSTGTLRCGPVLERIPLVGGAWESLPLPSLNASIAPKLMVVSPDIVVLLVSVYGDTPGILAVTTDGGQNWNLQASPTGPGNLCQSDVSLTAASPSDWWLLCNGAAAAGSSTKALMRTFDGGKTWRTVAAVTSLVAPPQPGSLTPAEPDFMASGSSNELWLAGFNTLTESADGGVTWTNVPGVNEQGQPAGSFDVLSSSVAWLLAPGIGLWATTNGTTWRPIGAVTTF